MPKQAAPEIALFFRLGNAKLEGKTDLRVLILRPESLNLGCFWPQEPHLTWLLKQRTGCGPWQTSWSPESNLCSFLPSACHPTQPQVCRPRGLLLKPTWQLEVQRSEIPRRILLGTQKSPNLLGVVIFLSRVPTCGA